MWLYASLVDYSLTPRKFWVCPSMCVDISSILVRPVSVSWKEGKRNYYDLRWKKGEAANSSVIRCQSHFCRLETYQEIEALPLLLLLRDFTCPLLLQEFHVVTYFWECHVRIFRLKSDHRFQIRKIHKLKAVAHPGGFWGPQNSGREMWQSIFLAEENICRYKFHVFGSLGIL